MEPLPPQNPIEEFAYELWHLDQDRIRNKQGNRQRLAAYDKYVAGLVKGKSLIGLEIGQPAWIGTSSKFKRTEYPNWGNFQTQHSIVIFSGISPVTVVLTYPYNWANITTLMPTNFAAVVTGATSPLTFSIVTGSLPSGLSLNSSSGLVYGTASMLASGTSGTIAIKVVDTNSDEDTSPTYTWNVT